MGLSALSRTTRDPSNTSSENKPETELARRRVRQRLRQHGASHDFVYNIVMVGEKRIGKTNVITRFTSDSFCTTHNITMGVDFCTRSVQIDEEVIKLQIWTIVGMGNFRSTQGIVLKNGDAVMFMFSVTDRSTLVDIGEYWMDFTKQYIDPDIPLILVGNKCDLEERTVSYLEAKDFATERNLSYMEVSAKDGTNVELAIVGLAARIRQSHEVDESEVHN